MIASHRAANVLATEEAVAAAAAAMAAEGPTEGNWSKDGIDSGGDSGAGPPAGPPEGPPAGPPERPPAGPGLFGIGSQTREQQASSESPHNCSDAAKKMKSRKDALAISSKSSFRPAEGKRKRARGQQQGGGATSKGGRGSVTPPSQSARRGASKIGNRDSGWFLFVLVTNH